MKRNAPPKKSPTTFQDGFLVVATAANRHCVIKFSTRKIKILPIALQQFVAPFFKGASKTASKFQKRLLLALLQKETIEGLQFEFNIPRGGSRILLLNIQPFQQSTDAIPLTLLNLEDITRLHEAEAAREQRMRELGALAHDLESRIDARSAELEVANEKLHTLSARMLETQELERRHLARELHDEIGQQITCLQVLALRQMALSPPSLKRSLKETQRATAELLLTVRQLSSDLRPQLLDDFGLIAALEWHFKRFKKRTGISVQLNQKNFHDELLNTFLRNVLFRVTQEALTNVARHADTNRVTVGISTRRGFCRLRVRDEGKGFDLQAALRKGSFGLAGMQERVFLAGGKLSFDSAPNQGTTVEVELPLISVQTNAFEKDHGNHDQPQLR